MEWISVKDRLPITEDEMNGRTSLIKEVIVFSGKYREVIVCTFIAGKTFEFWSMFEDSRCEDITHWMSLPEPPK